MTQKDLKKIALDVSERVFDINKTKNFYKAPFPHFFIDDFFDENFLKKIIASFPSVDSKDWDISNDPDIEVKMRSKWESEFDIPENIIHAVRIMNSSYFLKALSIALNIPKLMPDPYFSGGGLNATISGGLLDVHVDGNYHDASGLNRRVNAILYLNPNWKEGWGGEFGLYDKKGENLVKKIPPINNRLMVFDTNDYSFHGLPEPLNFPDDEVRRSIILYYYTKDSRPNSDTVVDKPHSALWKKRGWLDKKGNQTRDFH